VTVAIPGRETVTRCKVELRALLDDVTVGTASSDVPANASSASLDLNMRLSPDQLKELSGKVTMAAPLNYQDCWNQGLGLWSPEHPLLYELTISLSCEGFSDDNVVMQVGMRNLSWENGDGTFRLNGKPYFQALVLDQGYWRDTGLTPPSPKSLKVDIELSKRMGFNGCRKHQKVEDPIFLAWANKLGYLVWGEMASAYRFSEEYCARFSQEWIEAVKRDISHTCIVAWTPANESWGYTDLKNNVEQRKHLRALYDMTKYGVLGSPNDHTADYIIGCSIQRGPSMTTADGSMS